MMSNPELAGSTARYDGDLMVIELLICLTIGTVFVLAYFH